MWTVSTMHHRQPLDPLFRFRKVVVLVARQNGKSTVSQVLALFFLYVVGISLILGTAQDLDTAEEVWEGCLDIIEETPELDELADKPIKVNGKKTIRLLTGERYKVKAANRKAGRGLSGDLIMLDELREHQSWDAWAAITKTATARAAAMIWAFSNAGDMTSVVLRFLRLVAHEALGDPDGIVAAAQQDALLPSEDEISEFVDLDADDADEDDELGPVEDLTPEDFEEDPDDIGLFEWSAPPGCAVDDLDGIGQANPSAGYGISWRTLLSDARTEGKKADTEWVWRTEGLCQWPGVAMNGVFPPGAWEGTTNRLPDKPSREDRDAARIVSDLTAGLAVSADRSRTWVAFCGTRPDGKPQVDIVASGRGTGWVAAFLTKHKARLECVAAQTNGAGATSELIKALAVDRKFRVPVVPWEKDDLPGWHGKTSDALRDRVLMHNPQPALDRAAAGAVKKNLGGGWVLDLLASSVDAAPLQAFVAAYGAWQRPPKAKNPPPAVPAGLAADMKTIPGPGRALSADVATMRF